MKSSTKSITTVEHDGAIEHIVHVDPLTDPLYRELVDRYPSTVFASPDWIAVVAQTYGFEVRAVLGLDSDGRARAALPYCRVEDIRGSRVVSLPFSDYCDPLVRDEVQWQCLADELVGRGRPVTLRCVHNTSALTDERFRTVGDARWHGLDLTRNQEAIWRGLHGAARRAIEKARRKGLSVQPAESVEELRAFFELHLRVRKEKYQLLAQPYKFFEKIWERFVVPAKGTLLLAREGDRVIGGVLYLEWQDTLYYKFNASCFDNVAVRPNDLVIWEGILYGQQRGLTTLDFGLSDSDQEGLLRFKRKFATEEKTIHFLRHEAGSPVPARDRAIGGLLPQLTDLLTGDDVPDDLTERAGELLYRFFC